MSIYVRIQIKAYVIYIYIFSKTIFSGHPLKKKKRTNRVKIQTETEPL